MLINFWMVLEEHQLTSRHLRSILQYMSSASKYAATVTLQITLQLPQITLPFGIASLLLLHFTSLQFNFTSLLQYSTAFNITTTLFYMATAWFYMATVSFHIATSSLCAISTLNHIATYLFYPFGIPKVKAICEFVTNGYPSQLCVMQISFLYSPVLFPWWKPDIRKSSLKTCPTVCLFFLTLIHWVLVCFQSGSVYQQNQTQLGKKYLEKCTCHLKQLNFF